MIQGKSLELGTTGRYLRKIDPGIFACNARDLPKIMTGHVISPGFARSPDKTVQLFGKQNGS